jgi:hypothetical protein
MTALDPLDETANRILGLVDDAQYVFGLGRVLDEEMWLVATRSDLPDGHRLMILGLKDDEVVIHYDSPTIFGATIRAVWEREGLLLVTGGSETERSGRPVVESRLLRLRFACREH